MRKFLICISLALASAVPAAYADNDAAQTVAAAPERDYYLELSGTQRGLSPNIVVKINPGKLLASSLGVSDNDLAESLKALQFTSMIDAVNYLAARGWSVAASYTISVAGNTTVYMMMKQTTADPADIARTFIHNKK